MKAPCGMDMRFWVIPFLLLFVVFFGTAELYPWLTSLVGSPPGVFVAGVLLAIASNLDRLPKKAIQASVQKLTAPAQAAPAPMPAASPAQTPPSQPLPRPTANMPPATPPRRSISFTIKKPEV